MQRGPISSPTQRRLTLEFASWCSRCVKPGDFRRSSALQRTGSAGVLRRRSRSGMRLSSLTADPAVSVQRPRGVTQTGSLPHHFRTDCRTPISRNSS
jgi:hypothetical protein